MKLNFTGRGAMLYPEEGNTSAYYEEEDNFFLIDCGEDVARKLITNGKLVGGKNYYLFITHTHSDHIGSLGTLCQYLYWICHEKLWIVLDDHVKYREEIQSIIRGFGIEDESYEIIDSAELDNKFQGFNKIRYIESNHGDTPLSSASIIINTLNGNILYTGDIADTKVIESFIEISGNFIDAIYVDTSFTKTPVHLSIDELKEIIPEDLKSKVYCMHINSNKIIPKIKELGFNLVPVDGIDVCNRDLNTLNESNLIF